MLPNEFVKLALKTESNDFNQIILRLNSERVIRLLHASMGLVTEAAEMMDAMKKFIFYGKDLDIVNLKEELGDSDWYKAIAVDELGTSFEDVWEMVIKKLKARYGEKFNEDGAINRDLENERTILEKEDKLEYPQYEWHCPNCRTVNPKDIIVCYKCQYTNVIKLGE